MSKIIKKVLGLTLAASLAVPTAIGSIGVMSVAADDLPTPALLINMEDSTSNGYALKSGTAAVVQDEDPLFGGVLKLDPSTDTEDPEVEFTNPLRGLKLDEQDITCDDYEADENGMPIWYSGVTINYWIKTQNDDNSVVLNFRNPKRMQFQKDDSRKMLKAQEAKSYVDAGTEMPADFALADSKVYIGEDGVTEYTVYSSKSTYMQYNPNYVEGYIVGTGSIMACPKDADPEIASNYVQLTSAGESLYDAFSEYDVTKNPKSKVRYGEASGYFQVSADGSIAFIEDQLDGTQLNPNVAATYNQPGEFNIKNNFNWFGSEEILGDDYLKTAEWHMVTVVIQNDWFDFYIDGNYYDSESTFTYYGTPLNSNIGGKSFNAGFGARYPFQKGASARKDWFSGNRAGTLIVDWLCMDSTTFSIGGTNADAIKNQHAEKIAGYSIDDVAFYTEVLNEDQMAAIFDAKYNPVEPTDDPSVLMGDVDGDTHVTAQDALAILKAAAKLSTLTDDQIKLADLDADSNITASDALAVLKIAAGLVK